MTSEPSPQLLDLIYDAATDPALWPAVLAAVADLCECEGGMLYGQSVREQTVYFEHNGRLDHDCNEIYKAHHLINDWSVFMDAQPVGRIVVSDEILPLARLRRTAFYEDVLRPQSLTRNVMVALTKEGSFRTAFNINRTERQGEFEPRHLESIRQVLPHLLRSLRLAHRLDGYRALQEGQHDALDRLASGVLLLDRQAQVLYANGAAEALVRARAGLVVEAGILTCTAPQERRRLEALWRAVLGGQPGATMSLRGADGTLTLTLSSVRGNDRDRFSAQGARRAALLVFIADSRATGRPAPEGLQAAFGLSAAEARVAVAALDGGTIAQMAATLGVSPNTVKTHLARVFAKMGVAGRASLVRQLTAVAQGRPGARA